MIESSRTQLKKVDFELLAFCEIILRVVKATWQIKIKHVWKKKIQEGTRMRVFFSYKYSILYQQSQLQAEYKDLKVIQKVLFLKNIPIIRVLA